MKAVTIKYRDGKQQIASIRADECSGELPAYSNTYYCLFYRNGKQIARVAKSRLLPGYDKVYEKLFGRRWLEEVQNAKEIVLSVYDDWQSEIGGYPKDTEEIWSVNGSARNWVIECSGRSVLHIMNNDEIARKGAFKEALAKLFPGKKIKICRPTVHIEEIG
jgi:hypothetical protein